MMMKRMMLLNMISLDDDGDGNDNVWKRVQHFKVERNLKWGLNFVLFL